MQSMRRLILLACLASGLLAVDCGNDGLEHEEAIRQLEGRLTAGMLRDEIEATLEEMGLRYIYVPRSLLEGMQQATFESTPLSGRIQVTLPPDKRLFFMTVGEALVDLDEDERMVSLRFQRGDVPR